MKYIVQIQETLSAELQINAEDADHAVSIAMEQYYTCEVILGSEHFTGVTFKVKEQEND